MLLVEDDDLSTKVMGRIFRNDFEIFNCDSANEFYEKHNNTNFDIIIMDVSLNGTKNGLELIKEIKELPLFNGTPILCFTAHAQDKMRQKAFESGADYFITKPISNKILIDTVNFLLEPNFHKN